MKSADIDKQIKNKLKTTASPDLDQRIDTLINRAENAQTQTSNTWSIIMNNKTTKLATAAMIIIAVLVGINHFGGSIDGSSKAYAMSDMLEMMRNVETMHSWGYNILYHDSKNISDLAKATTVPVESWIDVNNSRIYSRNFMTSRSPGEDDFKVRTLESLLVDGMQTELHKTDNYVSYHRLTPLGQKLKIRRSIDDIASTIRPDMLESYENVGKENIDGAIYDIWQCSNMTASQDQDLLLKCWIDPLTHNIGQMHIYSKPKTGLQQWRLGVVRHYEINVPIEEDVFQIDIPQDCRRPFDNSTPEKAHLEGLMNWSAFPVAGVYLTNSLTCFTLEDGSVISAWSSQTERDQKNQVSSDGLYSGGSWPELPSILEKLTYINTVERPSGKQLESVYKGAHLAHTIKDSKFIEWGLYVPVDRAPISLPRHIYKCYWRHKNDPEKLHKFNPISGPEIKAEEFEELVLGAMAELSDDGIAPEGITYDGVLKLAQQIRESLDE